MEQMWDLVFDQGTRSVLNASNEMDANLLVTGSTGTGKSFLAQLLHAKSEKRRERAWQSINLATLSENIIESELFGHERGAFTGADSRRLGRLELSNGGTVFLDEIGELPMRLQAKLLDFIQYKKIIPVGGNRELNLDVRIIAATNRDLKELVEKREFRADLYHRLNVFHVRLPDLSENKKNVLYFSDYFLKKRFSLASKQLLGFDAELIRFFQEYTWPGNIRELENALEYAVAMERTTKLRLASLPEYLRAIAVEKGFCVRGEEGLNGLLSEESKAIDLGLDEALYNALDFHQAKCSFEKNFLENALWRFKGKINLTSRETGLNKVSLTEKIKKYDIDWRKIRAQSKVG